MIHTHQNIRHRWKQLCRREFDRGSLSEIHSDAPDYLHKREVGKVGMSFADT